MSKIIDMSHVIVPGKAGRKFSVEMVGADEVNPKVIRLENQWYIMHNISMVSHIGTHIEVPYHLLKDGQDLASFPLEKLCGEAIVLSLEGVVPKGEITLEQVQNAAEKSGGIQSGDIVLCNQGRAHLYGTEDYLQSPYFTTEALQWLVDQGMKMMGVDATGVELPGSEEHVNHHVLLGNGIPLIENLAGFEKLTKHRIHFYAFPIAVEGLESFPLRAVAIE